MLFFTALLCLSVSGILAVPVSQPKVDNSNYLLPTNFIPSHYDVKIDVTKSFVAGQVPKDFSGEVRITFQSTKATKNITLHASWMTITDANIQVYHNEQSTINLFESQKMETDTEFLHLYLNKDLQANEKYTILINYVAKLHNDMHGFYVSNYKDINGTEQYLLTTQFQPTSARRAFPCFDEPRYKATFLLTILKPKEYDAVISNTAGKNVSDTEVTFDKTNKMSTYLVAFIVSKFNYNAHENNNDYKVWSRPEAIKQTAEAVKATVPLVEELNKFTGIKYSDYVNKLDMAALPDFSAGAMENWGLLTYRETALLFDDQVSTNKDLQRIITVIAHELGHQWFGNLVTTAWWDNTWLNEGFARYIEYMITGRYLKEWEMEQQFVVEQLQSIFEVDALEKTTPLNRPVYTPSEISSHFGTISYSKGGSVIRMMEHFLGTNIFEEGLNKYLNNRKLTNTVPNNLWEDLEFVAKQKLNLDYSIEKIMNPWINQHGYPLVTVTVDEKYVTFEQERFFLKPEDSKASTEKWFIPISYTTSEEKLFNQTKPKLWLTPEEPKKTVEMNTSNWIIANIQETGYYRVNYNDEQWKKIREALMADKSVIDRINRAQIIDDALNLARAGILDYNIAFDIVDYLEKETEYYPWFSAFRGFRFLLQRYSESAEAGKQIRKYMKKLMATLIKDKTLTKLSATKQTDIYNVVSALEWACNLGVEDCVKDAKDLFKKDHNEINKNYRSIVYCTAIRDGSKDDWTKLWNRYVSSNIAAEKVSIINALGCSTKKDILDEYLLKSINDVNIRSQDASYVFSAVYTSGPEGVTAALEFLKKHPQEIINKYGGMNSLDNAVLGLAGRLTEGPQITQLKEVLENKVFENVKQAAIETTEQNTKWATEYGGSIESILKQKNSAFRSLINSFAMYLSLAFVAIYYKRY